MSQYSSPTVSDSVVSSRLNLRRYISEIRQNPLVSSYGQVTKVVGLVIEAKGIVAPVGELCIIFATDPDTNQPIEVKAEVVGFEDERLLLMPLGNIRGIKATDRIRLTDTTFTVQVGDGLLGRIVDALGQPIDGLGPLVGLDQYPVHNTPPDCVGRRRITQVIPTGIRVIDGLLSIGKGQRVGIFAGSGVGKSTLLGMIARNAKSDVNVIALIGERGREVMEFVEDALGHEGLQRSVVVAATSDQPPLLRVQGAVTATAIAEYFRDQGQSVMLMMDSVTRFAMAQREIGLSVGEPPATRGYTPSVFAKLPMLMERAGTTSGEGSITGLYTVLVEADDMNDPIGDTSRSILDGHVVLSRDLAAQNHYPAIDVSVSLSRLMSDIASSDHQAAASQFRQTLADYESIRDAYNIGAYTVGMNPQSDYAIENLESMNSFLRQGSQPSEFRQTVSQLAQVFDPIEDSPSSTSSFG
ncbi:MAG: FliI/YscN family ATPase [Candidatus Poribacteria bacterium]|nr:FliI/YscN family ATPase [Candidatus Poribacteria bacterium]